VPPGQRKKRWRAGSRRTAAAFSAPSTLSSNPGGYGAAVLAVVTNRIAIGWLKKAAPTPPARTPERAAPTPQRGRRIRRLISGKYLREYLGEALPGI
jgi:hypothetical protein